MLFGLIVIAGVVFLFIYMIGRGTDIADSLWQNRHANTLCPYCGKRGHSKRYHAGGQPR